MGREVSGLLGGKDPDVAVSGPPDGSSARFGEMLTLGMRSSFLLQVRWRSGCPVLPPFSLPQKRKPAGHPVGLARDTVPTKAEPRNRGGVKVP